MLYIFQGIKERKDSAESCIQLRPVIQSFTSMRIRACIKTTTWLRSSRKRTTIHSSWCFQSTLSSLWTLHTCLLRNERLRSDHEADPWETYTWSNRHTQQTVTKCLHTLHSVGRCLRVAPGPVQSFTKSKSLSWLTAASRAKEWSPKGRHGPAFPQLQFTRPVKRLWICFQTHNQSFHETEAFRINCFAI